ncbi:MAG TPA: outer membrane beta-barrel protein [Xanthobacteraceae bacterium]|nr:outer membrane beta-barrel protein [Xanthobacteraceae bacterium]
MAGTTSAFAADLPIPMKAPPVPFDPWTGWYVGANVGGSFGQANDTTTVGGVAFSSTTANLDGVIGGAQFGYNYHVNPSWLLGFETDFQGSSEQSSASSALGVAVPVGIRAGRLAPPNALSDTEKLPWFGTVRGRIGWTPNVGALIYVTGGLAYGGITSNETFTSGGLPAAVNANFNTTRVGWTIGGGTEFFVAKNWTVKGEVLYMDFGSATNTFAAGPFPVAVSTHITDFIARVGFNYHFW